MKLDPVAKIIAKCALCHDVNGAQHRCTCVEPCGADLGCYYMNNTVDPKWERPQVPVFKRSDVGRATAETIAWRR